MLSLVQVLMLSGLSVAREREQGTFDQLLVTPLSPAFVVGQGDAGREHARSVADNHLRRPDALCFGGNAANLFGRLHNRGRGVQFRTDDYFSGDNFAARCVAFPK